LTKNFKDREGKWRRRCWKKKQGNKEFPLQEPRKSHPKKSEDQRGFLMCEKKGCGRGKNKKIWPKLNEKIK
jgi:hypothetical protein